MEVCFTHCSPSLPTEGKHRSCGDVERSRNRVPVSLSFDTHLWALTSVCESCRACIGHPRAPTRPQTRPPRDWSDHTKHNLGRARGRTVTQYVVSADALLQILQQGRMMRRLDRCRTVYIRKGSISNLSGLVQPRTKEK